MADARRVALENVVRNAVNYREMARRSLGIIFLVLSEPDRQRFSEPFVQVLRDAVAFKHPANAGRLCLFWGTPFGSQQARPYPLGLMRAENQRRTQ